VTSHPAVGIAAIVLGVAIVITMLRLPEPRQPSRVTWPRVLGALWLVGGVCTVVATAPYLWRDNTVQPFEAFGIAAGLALLSAFVVTAVLSGRLALGGLVLAVVGFYTLWVGIGLVLMPVGIALFVGGLTRGHVVERRSLAPAVALSVASIAAAFAAPLPAPYWLFAAAALVLAWGVTIS
jgi:hypothetical protein